MSGGAGVKLFMEIRFMPIESSWIPCKNTSKVNIKYLDYNFYEYAVLFGIHFSIWKVSSIATLQRMNQTSDI